jgi:exonuclease SbcD
MAIKILATADLHLGKRSSGLAAFGEDCSTKLAWKRIIDYTVYNGIDVVLLVGDVIDRSNRFFESVGSLHNAFERLAQAAVEVYMVSGNHDFDVLPQVVYSRPFKNVHLLGANGQWELATYEKRGITVQFAGWSYPRQHVLYNPVQQINIIQPDLNFPSIGLLHADVDNIESQYAPVPLVDLQNTAIGIWMLGHIHKPSSFAAGGKLIQYTGSPQALSAKEPGQHGALVLTVDPPHPVSMEILKFSSVRFDRVEVDVSSADTEDALRTLITTELSADANAKLADLEDVDYIVYDLNLTGQNAFGRQMQAWASQAVEKYDVSLATETQIFVRQVTAFIRPVLDNLEALASQASPAGVLAQTILAINKGTSTQFLEGLIRNWEGQFRGLNNSPVYQPLQDDWQRNGNPRTPKEYILAECNRLLSELVLQSN